MIYVDYLFFSSTATTTPLKSCFRFEGDDNANNGLITPSTITTTTTTSSDMHKSKPMRSIGIGTFFDVCYFILLVVVGDVFLVSHPQ
jgi:hypothetical protein